MFRILSLDGGGIRGTFTASVLTELEEQTGQATKDNFDLIVGTSTGGILAIGLGLGFPASQLLDFYVKRGSRIFPHMSKIARTRASIRQIWKPKLEQEPLANELKEILGDRKFGRSSTRLVIPAYDAVEGRTYLFKTAHHKRFVNDINIPAADIALSTAAAPTYFDAAKTKSLRGSQYVDGGVWANNPSMVGLVEAIAFLNQEPTNIAMLSIGTTTSSHTISQHQKSGAMQWNVGLIDLLMRGQSEAASAQSSLILENRYHRIDHMTPEDEFAMDDGRPEKIEKLATLGRNQAQKKENLSVVEALFMNGIRPPEFQPFQVCS